MVEKKSLHFMDPKRTIIDGSDKFAYILPCKELRQWISNFTISFPDEQSISNSYTVMPHASATLVYYYNTNGLHSMLFGATTLPQTVGEIANKCKTIFIIEFQPAGFFPFSGVKQNELLNEIHDVSSAINPKIDLAIKEIFLKENSIEHLLQSIEKLLLDSIHSQYPITLTEAIQLITKNLGMISSKDLSMVTFYSERQLNRFFNQYLGLSMKAFSRIVRINNSLHLLNNPQKKLSEIIEQLGYYDDSHFIKDFKIACGITPQEYRNNMSDFYSEVAKF